MAITLQTSKLFTDGTATKFAAAVTYEARTDTATLDALLFTAGAHLQGRSHHGG